MNTKIAALAVVITFSVTACSKMTRLQQRALSGGAVGAAGGAAIAAMAGVVVVTGALIGALTGERKWRAAT